MSTKQAVIFAFMVVFLVVMLVTLGMWFHFSLELDIKNKQITALDNRRAELIRQREALVPKIVDPEKGLDKRIVDYTAAADAREAAVFTAPDDALKKIWEEQEGPLKNAWSDSEVEWKKTYEEWERRNEKIAASLKALIQQRATSQQQVEQEEIALKEELKTEDTEHKKIVAELKKWHEQINGIQYEQEEVQDKINKVTRELERSSARERDGVIIFADPNLKLVTVDLGAQHGVRSGMKFDVFSHRHSVPRKKGEIILSDVHATSSDAVIVPIRPRPLVDPNTHWEAPDQGMRYSPLSAAGADANEAQALQEKKSKKDLIEEIRLDKLRREDPEFDASLLRANPNPPDVVARGFEPIVAGDWVSHPEFTRIVTEREHADNTVDEVLSLRDVNVGTLHFFISDVIRPFRKEFLSRLIERNRCKVAVEMGPDVDYVITTADSATLAMLEERLKNYPPERVDVSPDIANRRKTLAAMQEGRKWGANPILDEELEDFFLKRDRKIELTKGRVKQPGQFVFFVVGETKKRSNRETGLYIQEHDGVMAKALDASVDYLVVGGGLTEAKINKLTGRIYYKNDFVPEGVEVGDFFEVVKEMGLKVIREEELAHFFGQE